ncbi:MAG: leucyl/phenylalanyl-tRNA--protein transferase [Phycisphaerales bacterium]|nr:leucyl/phenylalanyl-tRNA--protein transferase [Phycisphaerales bacterium]
MSRRLSASVVIQAYCVGYFPMADHRGRIHWLSPDPRCVFDLEKFRPSRSLRQTIRRGAFEVRVNTAFEKVMQACATRVEGTWISHDIHRVYTRLFHEGWGHSVETWADGELVGGLYGLAIGGAFFGESMFHRRTDASKVALAYLVERLNQRGFAMLDSQMTTDHLLRLGAIEISKTEYLERLADVLTLKCRFDETRPQVELPWDEL